MANLNYGEELRDELNVFYLVQSVWPKDVSGNPGVPDPGRERWEHYQSSAWNDKRAPNKTRDGFGNVTGNFDDVHADVAGHPSRVGKVKWDAPAFTDPAAALAYAARLEEFGEVAARFSQGGTQFDRDLHYLGRAIRARVVERYFREQVKVVHP